MPSSFVDSFPPIVKLLIQANPRRVMDIGPGWGKYGLACREYLQDLQALHAIEVHAGRLPVQDCIYDGVYTGDVRLHKSPQFWARWDLVLLIDVIEHVPHDDGHTLLRHILDAGTDVLVATPKQFFEQYDDRNPYETHRSHWIWSDFKHYDILGDSSTIDAIIYVLRGHR